MVKPPQRVSPLALFQLLGIAILLQGCVTPIEIKNASKAQLELIDSVDSAVADLQAALNQFHRDKEVRTLEEGRMLIARQAIDVAISNNKANVTADQLFDIYTKQIQPWVDYAFSSSSIDERIVALQKRISATSDPVLKVAMTSDLDDLQVLQALLQNKPPEVKELEAIIRDDLVNERKTARLNRELLEILRAQVALMRAMHARVDTWLAIDVTVTQEQADALKQAFNSAHQAIEGGEQ
jgi:hypothetical protein